MIHTNASLRYVVVEQHNLTLTPRARFHDKEEAAWYANNVWKAARSRGWFTNFRVLDVEQKLEVLIYGSMAPLYDPEIKAACIMYGTK